MRTWVIRLGFVTLTVMALLAPAIALAEGSSLILNADGTCGGSAPAGTIWSNELQKCVTPAEREAAKQAVSRTTANNAPAQQAAPAAGQAAPAGTQCPEGTAWSKDTKQCELQLPDAKRFAGSLPQITDGSFWDGAFRVAGFGLGIYGVYCMWFGLFKAVHLGHDMMVGKASGKTAAERAIYIVGGFILVLLGFSGGAYRLMLLIFSATRHV